MLADFYQKGGDLLVMGSWGAYPQIQGYADSGVIRIEGFSIMCDALGAYEPIMRWIENLLSLYPPTVTLEFAVEFSTTISKKIYRDILELLHQYQATGNGEASVYWYYPNGDADSRDDGEILKSVTSLPFYLVEMKADN